jgi:hypothetical protein
LGDVLAQVSSDIIQKKKVSSDGSGLPILCVHVPTAIPAVPAEPAVSAAPVTAL